MTRQSRLLEKKHSDLINCGEEISLQSKSKLKSIKDSISKNKRHFRDQSFVPQSNEELSSEKNSMQLFSALIAKEKSKKELPRNFIIQSIGIIKEENSEDVKNKEKVKKPKKTRAEKLKKWTSENKEFLEKYHISEQIISLPWDQFLEKLLSIFIPENPAYGIFGYISNNNTIKINRDDIIGEIRKLNRAGFNQRIKELIQLGDFYKYEESVPKMEECFQSKEYISFSVMLLSILDKHALMYSDAILKTKYGEELLKVYFTINDFFNSLKPEEIMEIKKLAATIINSELLEKEKILKKLLEDNFRKEFLSEDITEDCIIGLIIESKIKKFIFEYGTEDKYKTSIQSIYINPIINIIASATYDSSTLLNKAIALIKKKPLFADLEKITKDNYFIFSVPVIQPCNRHILGLYEINSEYFDPENYKLLLNLLNIKSS